MTKVQLQYELGGSLDEEMLSRIAGAHSIYGIHRLFVSPDQRQMTVDVTGTRNVAEACLRCGVPGFRQSARSEGT